MSLAIKVPPVGESITEVTIASWLKSDGDHVAMDEVICELESDKATFELNAEAAGILHIKAQEGDTVTIGDVVCEIDTEAAKAAPEPSAEASQKEKPAVEPDKGPAKTGETLVMKIPEVGESITEVTIASWLKKEGDLVELDEEIAEIESDKATFELTAEKRGILKIIAQEGDTIEIGAPVCEIEVMAGEGPQATDKLAEKEATATSSSENVSYATGHPSPAAAKILSEKEIDPQSVSGTGIGGRITKEDALKAQKTQNEKEAENKETAPDSTAAVPHRNQRRKKLSALRKTIARRLVAVKNETAMLTTFNEVDMKPVMDLRKKYKEQFKDKYEIGLGFMSFFTKAVCMALEEWPAVNATIDGDEVIYNDFCDISIAVSTPRGLVVPVIRNAESMRFDQIEKEIVKLATKARDNKLSIEEMTGGTFTITNGGVFGSMMSTPIINAPQSAILGMHNIVERPVAVAGEVVIRPVMYVALSYDHRIIDGRESVSFLVRVKQFLEDPGRLLLGI